MKQVIKVCLLSFLLVGTYGTTIAGAETKNKVTYKSEDNVVVTEYKDTGDFEIFIPSETVEKNLLAHGFRNMEDFASAQTSIGTRIGFFGVISIVLGGCQVIEYATDFDPCKAAVKYLIKGNSPSGKYKVTREWISGHVPGCEPAHSGGCNSGYFKYNFKKIG